MAIADYPLFENQLDKHKLWRKNIINEGITVFRAANGDDTVFRKRLGHG